MEELNGSFIQTPGASALGVFSIKKTKSISNENEMN